MDSNIRLFKKLNQCFNENIKLLFVNQFRVIFIVTKDDKVYRLRNSFDGFIPLLALSDDRLEIDKLIRESIFENLCNKGVIDLKNGPCHAIALTIHGQIYCWGYNNYGQLGNGQQLSSDKYIDEPKLNVYLSENNIKISQICCGHDYSLALTKNGDVFAWGKNRFGQIGNGDCKVVLIPYHVNDFNERVKAISCGEWHSMALTESGRVFSWGNNEFGQLGVGDNCNCCKPKMIELNDILIEKISCGSSHSLLLSRDKDIYVFGKNDVGQVGNRTQDNELTPFKISIQNKFIDIAAHYFYDFSAAQTANGEYYVWGNCGQESNTEPKETNFKSFNEIFENYFQITYEPIKGTFIQFNYDFVEMEMYNDFYEEIVEIGSGSYGQVFKVERPYDRRVHCN
jgi:alpha-tubulin suppressor-like RCC1 family protein